MRSSSFTPYRQVPLKTAALKDASDFLRTHDKLAGIMPVITRLAALQAACTAILPVMFRSCSVLSYESEQLVLAIPNAAIASKLKQQLPKLQDNLHKRGWQVIAIRLKVQVTQEIEKKETKRQMQLSPGACAAFADLDQALEDSPRNKELKAALAAMMQKRRP